jgi:DnaJ-domain-containing protein 1
MTDHFALLDQPRRPWLDSESLKQKFLARSAEVHPDRVHGADDATRARAQERYTGLNAAYLCLREPRDRLRHLLELELGRKPSDLQEMPAGLADFFMQLAAAFQETDAFLARYAKVKSPLLRAQGFSEAQSYSERLTYLQQAIQARFDQLLAEVRDLDRLWVEPPADPVQRAAVLTELGRICRGLGFFSRWIGQIQERLFLLIA